MYLATTALQEFWDLQQETVFLGSWCFGRERESNLPPGFRLMPSPWDARERFYRAGSYVDSCCEHLLDRLHEYLNRVHETNHSKKYWRIILGPWLILYSSVVYDRFVHLQAAFDSYPNLETLVMEEDSFRTPADNDEAQEFIASDAYNLQIFSQLLRLMNFSFPTKRYVYPAEPSKRFGSSRDRALELVEKVMRLPFQRRATIAITKTNLNPLENWKFAWRTRFRSLPLDFSLARKFPRVPVLFDEARLGLGKLPWTDSFQRILTDLLPAHFPTLYLEGHRAAESWSRKMSPAAVIVCGNAWSAEPTQFYAAQGVENGSHLVAVQHGVGYGTYRSAPYEVHERRAADDFLTWGWADDHIQNAGNIVNPRFSQLEHQARQRTAGNDILFVATGQPRYLYRFHSCPVGSQWAEYFDWQVRFFSKLPDVLRSIRYRAYPLTYAHAGQMRVKRSFRFLEWDASPESIWDKLIEARIVVIDHLGTTSLETLAGNIPTILFWDADRWEVRPEAEVYFENLRHAQILCDSPETAAQKLLEVYAEPKVWWNSDRVQTARREFTVRHALTKEDWTSSWLDNLRKIPAARLKP